MPILLIEDNADLAANIGEYLEEQGHIIDYAGDGVTGLHLSVVNDYAAIILDISLPGLDGLTLCQRLRQEDERYTPILMLTARDTLDDKLKGFDAGTDDYLTKPFSLAELEARLKTLMKRTVRTGKTLQVADLILNTHTMIVTRAGKRLELPPIGLRLLELLLRTSPGVVSQQAMERTIWGDQPPDSESSLRGHIHQLRTAIDQPFTYKLLKTVPRIGYRLAADDAE